MESPWVGWTRAFSTNTRELAMFVRISDAAHMPKDSLTGANPFHPCERLLG